MGKLAVLKPREVCRILETLGFVLVRQRGSHMQYRHADGRGTTVPNHPGRDISPNAFRSWQSLRRIHSEIALDNEPSRRMNLKLGFAEEGVLRSYQRSNDGKFTDIRILSLLRSDWETNPLYHNEVG